MILGRASLTEGAARKTVSVDEDFQRASTTAMGVLTRGIRTHGVRGVDAEDTLHKILIWGLRSLICVALKGTNCSGCSCKRG